MKFILCTLYGALGIYLRGRHCVFPFALKPGLHWHTDCTHWESVTVQAFVVQSSKRFTENKSWRKYQLPSVLSWGEFSVIGHKKSLTAPYNPQRCALWYLFLKELPFCHSLDKHLQVNKGGFFERPEIWRHSTFDLQVLYKLQSVHGRSTRLYSIFNKYY